MILRRVIQHVKKQEWTAIGIDFLIVVLGVFVGIQVSNWNAERETSKKSAVFTERLKADLRGEAWGYEYLILYNKDILANAERVLAMMDGEAGMTDEQFVISAYRAGYLPEERGLYPSMKAYEAIGFLGALRGMPLAEAKRRGRDLLEEHGLGHAADRQIRQLSKGMAQTVQLLGTLVHQPRLVVLDEPFSGLDAINQGKLELMIRALADDGVTVIFSTHVIHHAERLCEGVAIIAGGKVPYAGSVEAARDRIPAQVRLETRAREGAWLSALPADTRRNGDFFQFPLPESGIEPLLRQLIEGEAGILSLSIERAGLHDAFVAIAGEAAARQLETDSVGGRA